MEAVEASMAARAELTFCWETCSVVSFHLRDTCRDEQLTHYTLTSKLSLTEMRRYKHQRLPIKDYTLTYT